jgi:hypothetical protein
VDYPEHFSPGGWSVLVCTGLRFSVFRWSDALLFLNEFSCSRADLIRNISLCQDIFDGHDRSEENQPIIRSPWAISRYGPGKGPRHRRPPNSGTSMKILLNSLIGREQWITG